MSLAPAEYYVEGEKPGPLKEPEQKADMLLKWSCDTCGSQNQCG